MKKKLCKDPTDQKIAGVCSGFAKYLNVDVTIIRLIWALLFFCGGTGFIAYIVCALVMPEGPDEPQDYQNVDYENVK